ncbi:MAG: hypothetical protein NTY75_04235 [Candidatus Shapirobacteria bacterium]|nr:hypothetical protein [Candidatus Shapirobacteria bacterium]
MKNINKGQSPTSHKATTGQSLIEVVAAIGIVALVVTGMVALMTTALGTKTKGFDRKKAVEMSEIVVEQIIGVRNTSPDLFWDRNSSYWTGILNKNLTLSAYPGYNYNVAFNLVSGCTGCDEMVLNIGWSSSPDKAVFTRLFTKY